MNPASPSYRPDWWITTHIGALGGCVMGLAILLYFVVLVRTIAAHPSRAYQRDSALVPVSAAYHDEDVPALRNFSPWIAAAVLLIAVAYYPPIHDILKSNFKAAPGYTPESPAVVGKVP